MASGTNEPEDRTGNIEPEEHTAPAALNVSEPPDLMVAEVVDLIEREFNERFWPAYQSKVKKPAALTAYRKARKKASTDQIMSGLDTYNRTKPDWQQWAHPTSWLNQERWNDEPSAPPTPTKQASGMVRGMAEAIVEVRSRQRSEVLS